MQFSTENINIFVVIESYDHNSFFRYKKRNREFNLIELMIFNTRNTLGLLIYYYTL